MRLRSTREALTAKTLRFDAQHDELLEVLAKRFDRTNTEVVEIAPDDHEREDKAARTRAAFAGVRERDAELLDHFAR